MLKQPKIVNAGSRESIAAIFSLGLLFAPFVFYIVVPKHVLGP
jgi:hypothetical protein